MGNTKYLPIGSIIGDNYQIVDILGEDDFEILYLVRDTNRIGSFFVIKELFLETFSSRLKYAVSTIPEAQGVFQKRKQEIISEIEDAKRNHKVAEIKTYGYVEQNNTIYTIMEFSNNAELIDYLQFQPKEKRRLPSIEELLKNSQKKKKSFLLPKIFLGTIILAALAFYAFKMFQDNQKNKEKVLTPTLSQAHPPIVSQKSEKEKLKIILQSKPFVEAPKPIEVNTSKEQEPTSKKEEKKPLPAPVVVQVSEPSDILEKNVSKILDPDTNKTQEKPLAKELLIKKEEKVEEKKVEEKKEPFEKTSVKAFLDNFIALSANGSIENILTNYDTHVDRYFKLTNVNHEIIKKDKERYNRKWKNRTFSIENFKILKTYKKENVDYCNVQTTTKWKVSTKGGKKASGRSKGFMTLKKTDDGYRVTAIYGLK